ncbi:MAG: antitoxin Xre/MbcA/ParS toxin-binding domain-containing protein [Lentisphaeria bacterium]|jgi:putative toxin-antitoxin system antitoxin component (TIGR02293 family)
MKKAKTQPAATTAAGKIRYEGAEAAPWELHDASVAYVVDQVRSGLPVTAFTGVQARLGVNQTAFTRLTGISPRTLMRRRTTHSGRLTPAESAPVMRYALLYKRAVEVFGTAEQAEAWLKKPRPALGGCTPLDYASTEFGAREVEELLGRLEQGVFS